MAGDTSDVCDTKIASLFINIIFIVAISALVANIVYSSKNDGFIDYLDRDHSESKLHLERLTPQLGWPYPTYTRDHTEG